MLDSNVDAGPASEQFEFVQRGARLATEPPAPWRSGTTRCFHPGPTAPTPSCAICGGLLQQNGVDVIVAAHDHLYERFGKQDADGRSDVAGIRQFIVGTGGARLYDFQRMAANSQSRISAHGVLRLTLNRDELRLGVHRRHRPHCRRRRRRLPLKPKRQGDLEQMIAPRRDKTRGLLIAFEGPDGSGKTTQRKLLHKLAADAAGSRSSRRGGPRRRWSSR